jgi:hypothetical protein
MTGPVKAVDVKQVRLVRRMTQFFLKQLNGLDAGWSGTTTKHRLDHNDYVTVETTQVKVETPSFYDNRHMKVNVRPTHRLPLPPRNIPYTNFC